MAAKEDWIANAQNTTMLTRWFYAAFAKSGIADSE
jgi:hypothetical protein